MKYRKKPTLVDAVRFTKNMSERDLEEMTKLFKGSSSGVEVFSDSLVLTMTVGGVKKGTMKVMPGDWLIKTPKGEVFPCRDDVFKEAYDPVIIHLLGEE